jgi:predicted permease
MKPAAIWRTLLRHALHPGDRRFALADLEDGFEQRAASDPAAARAWYRQQVIRSVGPALADRWRRRPRLLAMIIEDLRFALRSLAKSPGVVFITVISLAVGIGATTAVFSAANALFRPPAGDALADPDTLAVIYTSDGDGDPYGRNSVLDVEEMRRAADALADVATHRFGLVELEGNDWVASSMIEIVSGNYFEVLGTVPVAGRSFVPDETEFGRARRVVVISWRMWQERFNGAADTVGTALDIDGAPFTIVGVAPAAMSSRMLALRVDAWVPLGIPGGVFVSTEAEWANRSNRDHGVVARLAPGATHETAAAQLAVVAQRLHGEYPEHWEDNQSNARAFTVLREPESRVPPNFRNALSAVSGLFVLAAALVLAIACFNVAGLMLARTDARRQEVAIRLALGAGRGRVAALLLTESLLIAAVSCGLGVLLAMRMIASVQSISFPIANLTLQFDVPIDQRVLAFAVFTALGTSLAFGMLPARRGSRPDLVPALKGISNAVAGGRRRFRSLLVLGQVAGALMFVVGAATALRSFDELVALDWGISADDVAMMTVSPAEDAVGAARSADYLELLRQVRDRADVREAQIAATVEGTSLIFDPGARVFAEGYDPAPGESLRVPYNAVSPGYLEMMQVRLIAGRTLSESDNADAARVAIVNESFARRFWPGADPLGQRFSLGRGLDDDGVESADTAGRYTVVGVAADARYQGFESAATEYFWTAFLQTPPAQAMVVVRAHGGVGSAITALREAVPAQQRGLALLPPSRLVDVRDFQFAFLRFTGRVLAAAGLFGLLLAAMGLYGTVAFAVTRRGRELAIRQAVGALPTQVVREVFSGGMKLALAGMVAGTAVVVPLIALLRAELEGVAPVEPIALVTGMVVVVAVTALASFLPARRATLVAPVETLRAD